MEARAHVPTSNGTDWKQLYMAALFEDDTARIPRRIVEAEMALAARAAQLGEGNEVREQQAMENAVYFLRLLRRIESKANLSYDSSNRFPWPPRRQEEWVSAGYSHGSRPSALQP
ncbi:MAG: hypothetical protein WB711_08825 [Terriglobales bacterium]